MSILANNYSKISSFFIERSDPKQNYLHFTFLGIVLTINALALHYLAYQGFNFYDYSGFLDAAWRVYQGQLPYIDFIYTTGPTHIYMVSFFFFLFGFGKTAILIHLITITSIITTSTFFMTRNRMPLFACWLVTLLNTTGFYWSLPHPWYDHSAYFWGILAVWFSILSIESNNPKKQYWLSAATGFCVIASSMAKTNIGFVFGPVILMMYLVLSKRFHILAGYFTGVLIACLLTLLIVRSPAAFIDNVFINYGFSLTRRLGRFTVLRTILKNYYWVLVLIAAVNFRYFIKQSLSLFILLIGVLLIAIFCLNTGSLRETGHISLFGTASAIGFILFEQAKNAYQLRCAKLLRVVSLVCWIGVTLFQMIFVTAYSFDRANGKFDFYRVGDYRIKAKALKGLTVIRQDGEILDQIVEFINQHIPKNESFLVLTDMQILYSLTERDSFRGIPFLFDVGGLPSPGKQVETVRNNIVKHPPNWILTNRDERFSFNPILIWLQFDNNFLSQYYPVQSWGKYIMFRRNY